MHAKLLAHTWHFALVDKDWFKGKEQRWCMDHRFDDI